MTLGGAPPSSDGGCCKGLFATVLAGTGFMMDAYDLFVINTVLLILKALYEHDTSDETAVATAAVAGSVCGQLMFGLVADRIGRKRGFIMTLLLAIAGALLSAMAVNSAALSVFVLIAISRFILGIGIGGEYPLSATISSENSESKHRRGQQVAMVFSMQGVGMLLAPSMGVLLLSIMPGDLDAVWRLLVGLAAVPGIVMMYWRCKMKETKAFARSKARRVSQWTLISRNWKRLVGTAGCWFLFDVTFYANGLFSSVIIHETGFSVGDSKHDAVRSATELNLILVFMALPGYYAAVFLIDRIGRRKLQMGGFIGMAVTYFVMGLFMKQLEDNIGLFFLVYGLSFFFSNCGPNTTTFVLPSEVFPTEVRATCHGLSAAAGKLGAVVGGAMIRPIMHAAGLGAAMIVFGFIALAGLAVTYFFVEETLGRSLDEVASGVSSGRDGDRSIALAVLAHDGNADAARQYRPAGFADADDDSDHDDDNGSANGGANAAARGTGIALDHAAVMGDAATTPVDTAAVQLA